MEILGYIASICIGLILGLLGGGGSILSIPILVYLFHVDAIEAAAYSLFIVGTTSLFGAIPKYREHLVSLRTAALFGIPSVVGTFLTRKFVVHSIPEILMQGEHFELTRRSLVLGLFAILMVMASVSMIRGRRTEPDDERVRPRWLVFQGLSIGALTGLVGAGGGFLIIPALVMLTGLEFKIAVGTSLFIIAANSYSGFIGDLFNMHMNWRLLLPITSLAILGILIGGRLNRLVDGVMLRKAFGWFTLAMGCFILIRESGIW
ncbi:MAG: sulfite exporter TauE/SafE family protein [Chryseolinea sp.]